MKYLLILFLAACAVHRPVPAPQAKVSATLTYEERKGIAEGLILGRGHTSLQCANDMDTEQGKCAACKSGELICFACENKNIGCNNGDQI